jgi:hypothetical protein
LVPRHCPEQITRPAQGMPRVALQAQSQGRLFRARHVDSARCGSSY